MKRIAVNPGRVLKRVDKLRVWYFYLRGKGWSFRKDTLEDEGKDLKAFHNAKKNSGYKGTDDGFYKHLQKNSRYNGWEDKYNSSL